MICEDFQGDIDPNRLGAWKLEAEANRVAIAGRKMYALFKDGATVKQASKGVRLPASDIESVAAGGEVVTRNQAPTFSLRKKTHFISRTVRRT